MQNYKQFHEEFMQNHNGTTSWETFSPIFPSIFEIFISTTLASFILSNFKTSKFNNYIIHFIVDFMTVIIPIILSVTVLNNYILQFTLTLFAISVVIFFAFYTNQKRNKETKREITSNRRHFITNSRATITTISIIAILAVDFHIFPRRFAKTETFGYSLMDVGVGLFVFSNGIVAPEISRKPQSLLKSVVSSIPLWLLGGARFLITKETDYHVHISEYGVHWNFFITLAVTKILSSCILTIVSVNHSLTVSVIVLTLHEILLNCGLSTWVLSYNARNTFLLANREGLVSSLGYVGLYFLSVHFGKVVAKSKNNTKLDFKLGISLLLSSLVMLCSVLLLEKYLGVSRRLANAGYCIWIEFIGVFMVALLLGGEHISKYLYNITNQSKKFYVPLIYEAISYNGLACFLLANVLTGLINVTIQTLTVGPLVSFIIITGYMFATCGLICIAYVKNIKLKLW